MSIKSRLRSWLGLSESYDLSAQYVGNRPPEFEDGERWIPLGGYSDNRECTSFKSLDDLSRARNTCREMADENAFAICGHENRISYLIGSGHTYTAVAKKDQKLGDGEWAQVQSVLDEFTDANDWCDRQQEIVRRYDRDGEAFLRMFKHDGTVLVRFIEPGQVYVPREQVQNAAASWGILTKPEDVEDRIGYYVDYNGEPELIDASEIQHRKANVDRNVKRGRPTFWSIRKELQRALAILHSMGVTCTVQSKIALIRRHLSASKTGLEAMRAANADYTWQNPTTGKRQYVSQFPDGAVIDASTNTEYDFPAAGIQVDRYVAAVQAQLRAAAARIVMPEFMFTADASNANYSSTMVAESPSVRMFGRMQAQLKRDDLAIIWRVLELAAAIGRISEGVIERIEIEVGMPQLDVRDPLQTAQAMEIYQRMRVMSPQTISGKIGVEYEQEQQNIEQHDKDHPAPEVDPMQQLDSAAKKARESMFKNG